ncbi:MAG: hypothetical protein QM784_36275 [Polyangiaceae bacterium]
MSPESSLEGELAASPRDDVADDGGFADAVRADNEKRTLDSLRAPVVGMGAAGSWTCCCAMSSSLPALAIDPKRSAPVRPWLREAAFAVAAARGVVETGAAATGGFADDAGAGSTGALAGAAEADAAALSASTISGT